MQNDIKEKIGFWALRLSTLLVLVILFIILFDIVRKGIGAISWEFFIYSS